MGPEDDDDRGGGGAECEAYHSRSNDTWSAGIRSHAAWAALSAQTPCILWALVLSSKTLRVRKSELSLSARYEKQWCDNDAIYQGDCNSLQGPLPPVIHGRSVFREAV
jgi:hypothetical protein